MKRYVLTFDNADDAREYAKANARMIYCRVVGVSYVLQVYPGGRAIAWPNIERYIKRLDVK